MGGNSSNYLWRLRHNTARPDIVGADQLQPVDALLVAQVRCTWRSSVHATPAAAWINLKEWGRGFLPVIPGSAVGRGPGIHTPDHGYGFRVRSLCSRPGMTAIVWPNHGKIALPS